LDDFSEEIILKSLNYVDRNSGNNEIDPIQQDMNELKLQRYHTEPRLHFDIPENSFSNTLRFMFSNSSNEWSYTQGNVIDLSSVEKGTTNLFVSKKIGISEWSSPTTISIYKTPPFYRAYWFYGLLISVFSFGTFVFINNRRVQALKLNRRIKREVEIKTMELFYKNKSLTESKRLNEQLFTIIGHDLRSPLISLNNISKSMHYLTEKKLFDDVKRLSETVESNSKKSLAIIDRLIEWTEKQKKSMLEFHEVNISELANKCIYEQEEFAMKKDIQVKNNGKKWIKCISNEASLLIVLGNVLSNAIKFSRAGGTINIKFYRSDSHIVIEVKDNGIGMDKALLDKINNAESVEPAESPSGEKGLGLGISLSAEIIKKINGQLRYQSTLGKGTTATIKLPN